MPNRSISPISIGFAAVGYGLVLFSPVVAVYVWSRYESVPMAHWYSAAILVLLIQTVLFAVGRRCATRAFTHWEGILIVAESASTRWLLVDVVVVILATVFVVLASCVIAILPRAPVKYGKLVAAFQRNRMEQ